MKVLATGTITGVTGAIFSAGVSSAPIDLSMERNYETVGVWASIQGDLGRTGGSIALYWAGSHQKSGSTFASPSEDSVTSLNGKYIVKSGTSISGHLANGSYVRNLTIPFPWLRLQAVASKAGVTNHGSGTTSDLTIKWAVCVS